MIMAKRKKETFVAITKKEIEERFDRYNDLYFGGKVTKPKKFEVSTPIRNILGLTRPMYNKNTGQYSAALHISRLYNWTDENLRDVIVHEMIHLFIGDYLQPLLWWELIFPCLVKQHDGEFKDIMKQLNENFGLHVQLRFPEMKAYIKNNK